MQNADDNQKATGRQLLLTAGLVGLLVSAAGGGTWAYYSATATNGSNTFDAGTVVITEDDPNDIMFTIAGMKPGDTVVKCVKVTYTGSITTAVHLYGNPSGALDDYLDVTVDRDDSSLAPAGAANDCTGFVTEGAGGTPVATRKLNTFAADYATGYDLGSHVTNANSVYRFTVSLPSGETQGSGATAAVTFTWEARAGS